MKTKAYDPKNQSWRSKVASVDEKGQVVIAVNAFNNEDSDGDISVPGSFKKTLEENFQRVKWFLNHNKSILLGVPLKGEETAEYLQMTAQFNMEKQISKDTYTDYKLYAENGRTLEHSIGVDAIQRDKSNSKKVTEWKLWEFSTLTSWGANSDTPLLSLKNMGGMSESEMQEQLAFITKALKLPYSEERLSRIEKSISIIEKIVKKDITTGALMVCCSCCGNVFDYNECEENTFEDLVMDAARDYVRWMIDNIVYTEMQKLRPEIQAQVEAIIASNKSMETKGLKNKEFQTKGIEAFTNYVRCPICWSRVYACNAIEPDDSTQEETAEIVPDDDMIEKQQAGSSTFSFKSIAGVIAEK